MDGFALASILVASFALIYLTGKRKQIADKSLTPTTKTNR
ncbi:hypothetical protein PPIS_a0893 [Pseudoalteromonas piscicida]|uniref:Uncharacterized protein n=1 Tax=Pseudoalteromonas piscicida TaxID=43662 RepID=A0ABN5C945_PSEO7|nr:hypothetical protein PPIS_a0890 [Pseudoalteromonas piscicida]ATD06103.1 hypothetical protein PPIS_a0893 [Pseudoalteromonas piscicida]